MSDHAADDDATAREQEPDWRPRHPGAGRLDGKAALITGGDSGIGRAIAALFAREGADVAIAYHSDDEAAEETRGIVEAEGRRFAAYRGDLGARADAFEAVACARDAFGGLDVLVNTIARQSWEEDIRDIPEDRLRDTFAVNVHSYVFTIQAALEHMPDGGAIVNTASVNAFRGMAQLADYSATRSAVVGLTRSLALQLAPRAIRVNCVAPGPIWTPLIPKTMPEEQVKGFGRDTPLGRPGQPWEVATSYLFLACSDGAYFTGQTLHPNGGIIVGS